MDQIANEASFANTSPTLGGQRDPGDNTDSPAVPPMPRGKKKKLLNSTENLKTLRQLEEWFEVERIRQAPNRYQQAIDHDFYDGLQWSDEDAQELALRGQAPLVYNKVQPAVKWITGTERRTRIDGKVLPRSDAAVDDAENKTKLLKYVDDVNKSGFSRSRAFDDTVKVGVGWLECGIRGDPTMELLYDRCESWRNIIYDSQGSEWDGSDWRYMFRQKWVDLDISQALFPEAALQLKSAAVYSDFTEAQDNEEWYLGQILQERSADGSVLNRRTFIDTSTSLYNRRARIKLYEAWYRKPTQRFYVDDPEGTHHNKQFDPKDTELAALYASQAISLFQRMGMEMWCAIFVRGTLLQDQKSPYKHNDFPFTPIWGNRRGRDNAPYGVIRVIRDPQEDFNKRMSKALHSLSTRRIIMDVDAVEDIDDLREEAARPDAIIQKKHGAELELTTDVEIAEAHIKYADIDEKMIQDLSGVTDDLMGRKTNAVSGIAIQHRQDQGSTVTTDLFDNLRLGTQLHNQKKLSLIGQYYTEKKEFRVLGSKRGVDFITINNPAVDPKTGQSIILNDVTATEADFIVSETDYKASSRQAMFETLAEMVAKFPPQIAMQLLDNVMEFSDVPGTEELVQTIRSITGKPDPDKRLTPEQKAQLEAKQQQEMQMQEEAKQIQLATLKANLDKLVAQAGEINAKAAKAQAEAQTVGAGDGGAGAMAADYAKKWTALKDRTDNAIFELRKQLMEADQRALSHDKQAETSLATAGITANTAKVTTLMKTESAERIAAINDRTIEATKGFKADIAGLDDDLKTLERLKQDKPTPVEEAQTMIADHKEEIAGKAKEDKTKAAIAKVGDQAANDPRFDQMMKAIEGLSAKFDKVMAKQKAAKK